MIHSAFFIAITFHVLHFARNVIFDAIHPPFLHMLSRAIYVSPK